MTREQEFRQKEKDRMVKQSKKEKAYYSFKEWLKLSLIKQREECIQKKMSDHQKQVQEQETKKTKEHMSIQAKIAFREWKERKADEIRYKKKVEAMEKRRQLVEEQQIRQSRRQLVKEMQKRQGGGGQILLAYGLNKNLKQLERAKSAKGRRTEQI